MTDDLREAVLAVLRDHGPVASTNRLLALVPRRRADVRAVLRQLEADGVIRRDGAGWALTETPRFAKVAADTDPALCEPDRGEHVIVGDDRDRR